MKAESLPVRNVSKSISFNGYEFDIESDVWVLNLNSSIDVSFISQFDSSIQEDIQATLAYFAENRSADHTYNLCNAIKSYHVKTGKSVIDESGLLSYKSIYTKKSDEYRLATLRVFLKQIYFLEFKAVSEQLFDLMNRWKLSGNEKGLAVLSLDPEEGPYSDIEFEAINSGLDNKYAESAINAEEYSLARLFMATGRRPVQIASLKIGDFRVDSHTLDKPTYMISIPKAKVRGGNFRSAFTDFALIETTGQVLTVHINNVIKKTERQIKRKLTIEESNLLPIFLGDISYLKTLSQTDIKLVLATDVTHTKTKNLTPLLRNIIDKLNIKSERTGKPLVTTGYRFRYSLGTRAARAGAGILTIGTLLDHSDSQNTKVYVANIPEHAASISQIMNGSLTQYANAFMGEIVESEEEVFSSIPGAQRIRTSDSSANVGSCGTNAMCHDYAPVACYTCPKFKPWRDAPHHLILKWLLDERQKVLEETGESQIAAINDRTIIAVTQVINACEALKGDASYDK